MHDERVQTNAQTGQADCRFIAAANKAYEDCSKSLYFLYSSLFRSFTIARDIAPSIPVMMRTTSIHMFLVSLMSDVL